MVMLLLTVWPQWNLPSRRVLRIFVVQKMKKIYRRTDDDGDPCRLLPPRSGTGEDWNIFKDLHPCNWPVCKSRQGPVSPLNAWVAG